MNWQDKPFRIDKRSIRRKRTTLDSSEYYESDEDEQIDEEDTRIVNGYEPDARPWLAFIRVSNSICGGALINHL